MSTILYISLPKKPTSQPIDSSDAYTISKSGIYRLSDYSQGYHYEYKSLNSPEYDGGVGFWEDRICATFNQCFINQFVYELSLGDMPGSHEKIASIVYKDKKLDRETKEFEINKLHEEDELWLRQRLYEFLHYVLDVGEFVEIYAGWDGISCVDIVCGDFEGYFFGPPTTEFTINLEDILNYEIVKRLWEVISYKSDSEGGHKLTIHRTV